MDKKGIELAINTLVMLILGIAILGIVIWLVTSIGNGGQDLIEVNSRMQNDLISESRCTTSLQSSGICVYPRSQTVVQGETAAYLIWVSNIFKDDITEIVVSKTSGCSDLKGLYSEGDEFVITETIKPGEESKIFPAFVNPNAETCAFKVEVKDAGGITLATETFFLKTE